MTNAAFSAFRILPDILLFPLLRFLYPTGTSKWKKLAFRIFVDISIVQA